MVGAGVAGSALAYKQGKVSFQALIKKDDQEQSRAETPFMAHTWIGVGIPVIMPC